MFRHPGAGGRVGRERDEKERRENADELLNWMCGGFFFSPQRAPVQVLCKYNQVSTSEISGIKHEFNFFFKKKSKASSLDYLVVVCIFMCIYTCDTYPGYLVTYFLKHKPPPTTPRSKNLVPDLNYIPK